MCEHHHSHNKTPIKRVIVATIILIATLLTNAAEPVKISAHIIAYLIAGYDVLFKAIKNIIKGKVFDENFLMSIATVGALAIKEYPEATMVMILYQIGEYFQHKAVEKSKHSISELMDLRPDYANLEKDGKIKKTSPTEININDTIIIYTGEKIPLDGVVINGNASVDTSALTGEPIPKEISTGDEAISGCINLDGILKIKVTKQFEDSTVSKILEMVEHAATKKAKTENFITKFAKYYTPIVVLGAIFLAVIPPMLIDGAIFSVWLERSLTFLVISCPCALVISVPLSFFGGIGGASKCGILIKGSSYLEVLSNPESVIFDKTGTLTKGVFKVTDIHPINITDKELLKYAAYAENASSHPIALSLKNAYKEHIDQTKISDIKDISGKGIKANIDNKTVLVGNKKLLEEHKIELPKKNIEGTTVHIAINNSYAGYIVISDEIKNDAILTIQELKNYVKNTIILTGDTLSAAEKLKNTLDIDFVYANLLPNQKVEKLEEIIKNKNPKKSVIFVGDGINDAPALTLADAGIAMGALGSDAAIEAADIVIMDDKPSKTITAIKIAKKTMRIAKQNIIFAISIKILFLTLGSLGMITMWGAVFADVGVAIIAIINSMRTLNTKSLNQFSI